MPTPKLRFQEQKAPKSGRQYNFQEHTSKHIPTFINKSGCQTLQENHWAFYHTNSAQLRKLFMQIMLAVRQSNCCTTALKTSEFMHVSPFLSMVTKDHFSWDAFINIWKCLHFARDGFAGARSLDSTTLSLEHETFS